MEIQQDTIINWRNKNYKLIDIINNGIQLAQRINSKGIRGKVVGIECYDPINILVAMIGIEMSLNKVLLLNPTDVDKYNEYNIREKEVLLIISEKDIFINANTDVIIVDFKEGERCINLKDRFNVEEFTNSLLANNEYFANYLNWKKFTHDVLKFDVDQFAVINSSGENINQYILYSILTAKKQVVIYEFRNEVINELIQDIIKDDISSVFMPLKLMQLFEYPIITKEDLSINNKIFITYGFSRYDFTGLKKVIKRKGAYWFNYFGTVPFQMISSLNRIENDSNSHLCKEILGTNVTIRNNNGGAMPEGVPGIMYFKDFYGKEFKSPFVGKQYDKNKILHTGYLGKYYEWNSRLWPFEYINNVCSEFFGGIPEVHMDYDNGELCLSLYTETTYTLAEQNDFLVKYISKMHPSINLIFFNDNEHKEALPLSFKVMKNIKEQIEENGMGIITLSSYRCKSIHGLNIYVPNDHENNSFKYGDLTSLVIEILYDVNALCDEIVIYEVRSIKNKINLLSQEQLNSLSTKVFTKLTKDQELINVENEIIKIWKEILKCKVINIDSNFFDLGGNSIQFVELTNKITEKFGKSISIMKLIGKATIRECCKIVVHNNEITSNEIPLKEKILKDIDVLKYIPNLSMAQTEIGYNTCLLTGATGFLGVHILECLVKKTDLKIICLIRGKDNREAKERLVETMKNYKLHFEDERIIVLNGDIRLNNLGLEKNIYTQLCKEIDIVVNNAALPNFAYTYEMLKEVNVIGTGNMLTFATTIKKKYFYHISSMAVLGAEDKGMVVTENYKLNIDDLPNLGYNQSKWVADYIVTKSREYGVHSTVLRIGGLCGSSNNGITQTKDFIWMLIKLGIELKSFPHYYNQIFSIDTVNSVAGAIVGLIDKKIEPSTYHLFSGENITYEKIKKWVRSFGFLCEEIEFKEWAKRIMTYTNQLNDKSFESVATIISSLTDDMINKSVQFIKHNNSHTLNILETIDAKLNPIDEFTFHKCLQYFIDSSYINGNR